MQVSVFESENQISPLIFLRCEVSRAPEGLLPGELLHPRYARGPARQTEVPARGLQTGVATAGDVLHDFEACRETSCRMQSSGVSGGCVRGSRDFLGRWSSESAYIVVW